MTTSQAWEVPLIGMLLGLALFVEGAVATIEGPWTWGLILCAAGVILWFVLLPVYSDRYHNWWNN